ncbi:TPA: hypothetical protein N2903_000962 [Vibrio parahaemolyticus]|uniref:hypothetical protein n=1 Tax=Vibrio harveyi group TaxID=717610 RepID=UPI001BD5A769|nr:MULTISPECIES: hypothetical protein [Vibrio harveyi group]MBT0044096.1 hypothetical protein [Vibrio alginolyticus]HCM1361734.1 hypothetical protein [Vibrio parahaemolyticus]HDY7683503.1 hypothetical protein [Vibrio vulnificus]
MSFNIVDTKAIERSKAITDEYGDSLSQLALSDLEREYQGWYKTEDVAYIDAMASLLAKHNAPITGDILKLVGQLASDRLEGHRTSNKDRKRELKTRKRAQNNRRKRGERELKRVWDNGYLWDVFALIELCDLPARDAYRGVAAKLFEDQTGMVKGKSTVTIRTNYSRWKNNNELMTEREGGGIKFYEDVIETYREQAYPNKTKEQIRNDILGDIDPWHSKYDHLGDGQS